MDYTLSKITTEYNSDQDRIRLLGNSTQSVICEIWLSNRLLNRLITALLDNKKSDDFISNAVQAFEQQAATAAYQSQAPVQAQQETVCWLATSIDVSKENSTSKLEFKDEKSTSAAIVFNDTELRQWLDIIFKTYQKAEWSLAVWPTWFQQMKINPAEPNNDALH